MAECIQCHQALVESYGAVVELVQSGEVIRKASLLRSAPRGALASGRGLRRSACEKHTATTRTSALQLAWKSSTK